MMPGPERQPRRAWCEPPPSPRERCRGTPRRFRAVSKVDTMSYHFLIQHATHAASPRVGRTRRHVCRATGVVEAMDNGTGGVILSPERRREGPRWRAGPSQRTNKYGHCSAAAVVLLERCGCRVGSPAVEGGSGGHPGRSLDERAGRLPGPRPERLPGAGNVELDRGGPGVRPRKRGVAPARDGAQRHSSGGCAGSTCYRAPGPCRRRTPTPTSCATS